MIRTSHWLAAFALFTIAIPADQPIQAAEQSLSGQAEIYQTPKGLDYAALSVQLNAQENVAPEQLLILVDTSASQVGDYRVQSLDVVTSLLQKLSSKTQVAIWAIDVEQTPMTDGFVSLTDQKITAVQTKLKKRIPAGSTNLSSALENGLKAFDPARSSAIVYIGDGYSAARLISPERLTELVGKFSQKQVPVNSYAVGAQIDMQLLGILALRSGGAIVQDGSHESTALAADQLVQIVSEKVWYPQSLQVSENLQILPAVALPVRSDRATIYLTQIKGNQKQATLSLADANRTATVRYNLKQSPQGHVALRAMYLRAIEDRGLSVPTAGNGVLQIAIKRFEQRVAMMLSQANQAAKQGNSNRTVQVSKALLQFDPANSAASKLAAIHQVAMLQPKDSKPPAIVTESKPESKDVEKDRTDAPSDVEKNLIEQFKNRAKIAGEKLSLQVDRAVMEARQITEQDPDAALSILKGTQGTVRNANDIDPDVRRELERKVGNVILEVRARKEKIENNRVRFEQRLAEREARRRIVEDMMLEEERLEQLIDQVRALLDDGRHGNPTAYAEGESVAKAAVDLAPSNGAALAARITSVASKQLEDSRYLRLLRADRFLETLSQVEFSHVAFPDEPPVRYPPAPVWKALTERRKIWASVDLKDDSPAERRIGAALQEETEFQFVDTPLIDALDIIGEMHNITILIDDVALEDEGISTDEPINLFLSGIRLKSALRIMLEKMPAPLTWIIQDEVMKITTELVAEEATETRVYPVADLVIPIQPLQGQGGFGGGGGGGQQGGGQQGGGFGGGGQGGGGGGGGGFFSIPAANLNPAAKKKH